MFHLNLTLNRTNALQQETTVFFLDLNRFKVINYALGHNIGDQLLQLTAKRLSSAIPDNGFIARLGGDEFIIILTNTNTDTDEIYLIEQFEMPFMIQQRQLITSVSTGIAVPPRDGIDRLKLMN